MLQCCRNGGFISNLSQFNRVLKTKPLLLVESREGFCDVFNFYLVLRDFYCFDLGFNALMRFSNPISIKLSNVSDFSSKCITASVEIYFFADIVPDSV